MRRRFLPHGRRRQRVSVRNGADSQRRLSEGSPSLAASFSYAGEGLAYALLSQRNMKIHIAFAALAVIVGALFRIDAASWLAVIVCIALVISLECLNTALEALVDLVSPEYHVLAKRVKDCAAAAVAVCAVASVIVEAVIIVPRIVSVLGS